MSESRPRRDGCESGTPSWCVELVFVQEGSGVPDTESAHTTTNIDLPRPSETPQRIALEIEFDEKIAQAEAAAHFRVQFHTDEDQIDKEHG